MGNESSSKRDKGVNKLREFSNQVKNMKKKLIKSHITKKNYKSFISALKKYPTRLKSTLEDEEQNSVVLEKETLLSPNITKKKIKNNQLKYQLDLLHSLIISSGENVTQGSTECSESIRNLHINSSPLMIFLRYYKKYWDENENFGQSRSNDCDKDEEEDDEMGEVEDENFIKVFGQALENVTVDKFLERQNSSPQKTSEVSFNLEDGVKESEKAKEKKKVVNLPFILDEDSQTGGTDADKKSLTSPLFPYNFQKYGAEDGLNDTSLDKIAMEKTTGNITIQRIANEYNNFSNSFGSNCKQVEKIGLDDQKVPMDHSKSSRLKRKIMSMSKAKASTVRSLSTLGRILIPKKIRQISIFREEEEDCEGGQNSDRSMPNLNSQMLFGRSRKETVETKISLCKQVQKEWMEIRKIKNKIEDTVVWHLSKKHSNCVLKEIKDYYIEEIFKAIAKEEKLYSMYLMLYRCLKKLSRFLAICAFNYYGFEFIKNIDRDRITITLEYCILTSLFHCKKVRNKTAEIKKVLRCEMLKKFEYAREDICTSILDEQLDDDMTHRFMERIARGGQTRRVKNFSGYKTNRQANRLGFCNQLMKYRSCNSGRNASRSQQPRGLSGFGGFAQKAKRDIKVQKGLDRERKRRFLLIKKKLIRELKRGFKFNRDAAACPLTCFVELVQFEVYLKTMNLTRNLSIVLDYIQEIFDDYISYALTAVSLFDEQTIKRKIPVTFEILKEVTR